MQWASNRTGTVSAGGPERPHHARRRARSRLGEFALVAVALACLGFGVAVLLGGLLGGSASAAGTWPGRNQAPVDMDGNVVQFDPGGELSSEDSQAQDAVAEGYGRFVVPSVGLDVPLGRVNAVNGVISPPGFTSAYWVANIGVAPTEAADGAVYVAMHSLRGGGRGPGDYLYDSDTGRSKIEAGSQITVGAAQYTVEATLTVPKSELPAQRDVWDRGPGTLVVFTCLQLPDGSAARENFVVIARLA